MDLEKFFDRVNHDKLMSEVAKRVKDRRILRIIRRFLEAGVLEHDALHETTEGTPQGGPLSPLLANLLLDRLDRELERRGHRFVRYADDCNIYVRSRRAGCRVMRKRQRDSSQSALSSRSTRPRVQWHGLGRGSFWGSASAASIFGVASAGGDQAVQGKDQGNHAAAHVEGA